MGEPQRPQTAGWVAACPLICCVIRSVGAPALTPVPAPPPPLPRYYKKVDEPLLTGAQLAALAAAESADSSSGAGTGESGARKGQEAQQAQQGELAKQAEQAELPPQEQVAPVPPDLKAQLAHYRWAACLCYDYNTGGCGASSGRWSCCCRQQVAAARLSLAVCGMG